MLLKKYFMKSVDRISKDFKHKELLPLKLVFFVQASTISVLYPYLTIHMRELGINVEEAAIMSAVIPVIGIIMPPLAGMIADKIGNFKLLLALSSLIAGGAALLLLTVPVGRTTVKYPEEVIMDFSCDEISRFNASNVDRRYFALKLSEEADCDRVPNLNGTHFEEFIISSRLEDCGFLCRTSNDTLGLLLESSSEDDFSDHIDPILMSKSYTIQIKTSDGVKSYHYNLGKSDALNKHLREEIFSDKDNKDVEYKASIHKMSQSKYYFPAMEYSNLLCKKVPISSGKKEIDSEDDQNILCYLGASVEKESDELVPETKEKINFAIKKYDPQFNEFFSHFANWSLDNFTHSSRIACGQSKDNRDISVHAFLKQPSDSLDALESVPLTECQPKCLISVPRKLMCTNLKKEINYDPRLTFWIYLVIRVFIGIIGSTAYAMYEVAVIAILREHKADYGLQRIYASIGGMIASPVSGILIDYASQGKDYTDFSPAFYLYAGLKVTTTILMLFINLEFKQAASNVISDAIEVLKNIEIIALLIVCFILGSAWGYIESFLFWFLEDLGGKRSLMGITITVGGIAGIPLLVLSGPIINKIGHANVLFLGFVFYAIRLFGYSIIYNPYHCLFFEAMESITSSLAFTAAVTYAARLSTTTTDGSVQGLVGGLYFGVGRGAGSLIGGYLMEAFGTRSTFQIFAAFIILSGIIYFLFNQFYIKKRPRQEGNDICKKEKPTIAAESDVKIITEKPKDEKNGYGAIRSINNNIDTDAKKSNQDYSDSEKIEDGQKKMFEGNQESHDNLGYVNDEEKTIQEDDEKLKEDLKKEE